MLARLRQTGTYGELAYGKTTLANWHMAKQRSIDWKGHNAGIIACRVHRITFPLSVSHLQHTLLANILSPCIDFTLITYSSYIQRKLMCEILNIENTCKSHNKKKLQCQTEQFTNSNK